jgi:hypothetical protein
MAIPLLQPLFASVLVLISFVFFRTTGVPLLADLIDIDMVLALEPG